MKWLVSLALVLVPTISVANNKYIPDGIVITQDISAKIDLGTILDRIAEIDSQTQLGKLIDTIIVDETTLARRKSKVIIIDAGHGGKDEGTTGIMGTVEKELVLQYSLLLGKTLRNLGYTVFLTRNSDLYLTLIDRRKFAQNYHGSLMIAVHADSAGSIEARGLSVYTLSEEASDDTAKMLASGHNNPNDITFKTKAKDPFIKNALIDVFQNATVTKSQYFANLLIRNSQQNKLFTIARPHRFAGFAVLKMPDVPSVLIELGFLSSPEEEILLRSPAYRGQIIRTVAQTIDNFFGIQTQSTFETDGSSEYY